MLIEELRSLDERFAAQDAEISRRAEEHVATNHIRFIRLKKFPNRL
jgi:hypothetical protein